MLMYILVESYMSMQILVVLSYEFGPRVVLGRVLSGPSWFWAELSVIHLNNRKKMIKLQFFTVTCNISPCTGGDFPCTGDIHLMPQSEGRCTYLTSLQMTLETACMDIEIFLAACGHRTWDL